MPNTQTARDVLSRKLIEAADEVLRISERDHAAWNRLRECVSELRQEVHQNESNDELPVKHYLEMHITLDPVPQEKRILLQKAIAPMGFKLAKLLMDKGVPSQLDTFMTGHAKNLVDAKLRTINAVCAVQVLGVKVRRYKIEDTVLDSRIQDELNLGVVADRGAISL